MRFFFSFMSFTDTQYPRFGNCPVNQRLYKEITTEGTDEGLVVTFNVEPQDNAGAANLDVKTTPLQSGDRFPYGSTPVVVNATDPSGNSNLCQFSVIVRGNYTMLYCAHINIHMV